MRKLVTSILIALLFCQLSSAQNVTSDIMAAALEKLSAANASGSSYDIAEALCEIASLDISASLDAEAEKCATQAEQIARKEKFDDILARALILKANICSYAETDESFNRNDEGVQYALEALQYAEAVNSDMLVYEACCSAAQLYVNKNRWLNNLNMEWYNLAGQYLDRAEAISRVTPPSNPAKLMAFRIRYFRQGGLKDKAISYCEKVLETSADDDYLIKAQACDQLMPLYIETGEYEEAAQAHSAYVHYYTLYTRQNEAGKLQELQEKYESELRQSQLREKTYMILFLCVAITLLVMVLIILAIRMKKVTAIKNKIRQDNLTKQELIDFITKDIQNPVNNRAKDLGEFIKNAGSMNEDEVAEASRKLIEEEKHLSHEVAEYVSNLVIKRKKTISDFGLSSRELEIIRLSIEGLSATQIAERLSISPRTVSNHKANIYSKMNVRTNAEMCKAAMENNLF